MGSAVVKLNRFYRDELNFLRLQGREFAEAHPQLTRFLSDESMDPDVERLLEGFAFMTGRLREKVEDEFPELTHSLLAMLWPNYLRPIPSATIVRFDPHLHAISERQTLPRGTRLDSRPVQDGIACHFRTCHEMAVDPLMVNDVHARHSREVSELTLSLDVHSDQSPQAIGLDSLRLHLGGERYTAQTLYLWLNHYLERVTVEADGQARTLPTDCLTPVGFDPADSLLPYPRNAFDGYRILQEYLCFPEAFHFMDLGGLQRVLPDHPVERITLKFLFGRTLPPDAAVDRESVQLHCTPAVNLFTHEADPIDLNGRQTEYRVRPSTRQPRCFEVFSVDSVEGWLDEGQGRLRGAPRPYTPFESFEHQIERERERTALYYRVRVRESLRDDGFDHAISFVRGDESECLHRNETISLTLTCTNRELPQQLAVGDLCVPTSSTPSFVAFRNITRPTPTLRPSLDGSLLWTLISNLSLNYQSLLSLDALKSVLRVYDFRALVDRQAERVSQQRMAGIVDIETEPTDRLYRGLPVRGIRSKLTLDPRCFGSEGDLYLFGTVLSRFFGLYASINSFHLLDVVNQQNQEQYTWTCQAGQQPLV